MERFGISRELCADSFGLSFGTLSRPCMPAARKAAISNRGGEPVREQSTAGKVAHLNLYLLHPIVGVHSAQCSGWSAICMSSVTASVIGRPLLSDT